jgi:hypothetical protein
MSVQFKNLDQTKAYAKLGGLKEVDLKAVLDADRVKSLQVASGAGLTYNYAAKKVSPRDSLWPCRSSLMSRS